MALDRAGLVMKRFFIGTYSEKDGQFFSVYVDKKKGKLFLTNAYCSPPNPSFLAWSNGLLYVVSEQVDRGIVSAYQQNNNGELSLVSQQTSKQRGLCHICAWPNGKAVTASSYLSGGLLTYKLNENGTLSSDNCQWIANHGSSVNPTRQKQSHVHSCTSDHIGKYFVEANLGTDYLTIYQAENGNLTKKWAVQVPAGEGPRHFVFHPHKTMAYLITEMGNSVIVYQYNPENGQLVQQQILPLFDKRENKECMGADIHVTPDGRFLFATTRGLSHLIRYKIGDDGFLSEHRLLTCEANHVRGFCIDDEGEYILVADQIKSVVILFKLDTITGDLSEPLDKSPIPNPTCIICAPC